MSAEREKCKETVAGEGRFGGMFRHACTRFAKRDGYCNQHHPNRKLARDKAEEEAYQRRVKEHRLRAEMFAAVFAADPATLPDAVRKVREAWEAL